MPDSIVTVNVTFKPRVDKDTGRMSGFELEADGFHPTLAARTGDEQTSFWEFDIAHKASGYQTHVIFPWTVSLDVLETLVFREMLRLNHAVFVLSKLRK